MKKIDLEISKNSCDDYILYFEKNTSIAFESQFDNEKFNGKIYICKNLDNSDEEWELLNDKIIYEIIKNKSLIDFERVIRRTN